MSYVGHIFDKNYIAMYRNIIFIKKGHLLEYILFITEKWSFDWLYGINWREFVMFSHEIFLSFGIFSTNSSSTMAWLCLGHIIFSAVNTSPSMGTFHQLWGFVAMASVFSMSPPNMNMKKKFFIISETFPSLLKIWFKKKLLDAL